MQRVRLFVKGFLPLSVSIHVHRNVHRPSPASPPVGNFHCTFTGRLRRELAGTNHLCLFQRFKNFTHICMRSPGRMPDDTQTKYSELSCPSNNIPSFGSNG